jgi:threonine dehydrogenase-like Zn-dependent dehydrogenase
LRALTFTDALRFDAAFPGPQPAEGEAIVRVHLAGICATDLELTRGYMNFRGVLGHEMVGTVSAGTQRWQGKRVVAQINCPCGKCDICVKGLSNHCPRRSVMGIAGRNGCFADFVTVPETNLLEVPSSVTDEAAVFVEPLAAAYQVLAQCPVDPKTTVSVVGPGRLGLLVAQVMARTDCRLTVIGRNPSKLERCDKLGIQSIHVDDLALRNDRDVVVDCSCSPDGIRLAMGLVRPRGTVVLKSTYSDRESAMPNLSPLVINEVKLIGSRCGSFGDAINALARKAVEVRSLITRTLPLEQGVAAFDLCLQRDTLKVLLRIHD